MKPNDAMLLAYHAGALEPGPHAKVQAAVGYDPLLALRLAELAGRLIEPQPTDPFRIPPPGLGFAGFGLQGTVGAVMSRDEQLRPGDRFRITLEPTEAPEATRLVVLYRTSSWDVVFPSRPEEDVSMAALPTNDQGQRVLDLSARSDTGRQRWAVALPPMSMAVDWQASPEARWRDLQHAVTHGRVPVASVEVTVG